MGCLGLQNLQRILLPGNRLDEEGMSSLCSSLKLSSLNIQSFVVDLDLTCCGLEDNALKSFVLCSALHVSVFAELFLVTAIRPLT